MKTYLWAYLLVIGCFAAHVHGQTEQATSTAEAAGDDETASEKVATEGDQSTGSPSTALPERTVPNVAQKRMSALRAQYPEQDIRKLTAVDGEFTALWRKDRSGGAFGAVLIVPTDGQTANWPHTIEPLRTELPKYGWSTLSIDIPADASKNDTPQLHEHRIRASIEFLHEQGQYNIILVGFGFSAHRIMDYAQIAEAPGMKRTVKTRATANRQRPVRAIVIINAKSDELKPFAPQLRDFEYKEMPLLDLVVGKHYLDRLDAEEREQTAREHGYETYIQFTTTEPSTTIFGSENRLSRRVLGFLNTYAKGVEIERR